MSVEEYLLPSVTKLGEAAVFHQESEVPKQEGSWDVRQKKKKQKSTTMLNCLEENLPEIFDPSKERKKNDWEI